MKLGIGHKQGFAAVFLLISVPVLAVLILVLAYLFIVQPNMVAGKSMSPTFPNKAYVLSDKLTYRFQSPNRGDVVIFRSTRNNDIDYIARIVGLPEETVTINNGQVLINGVELFEPYASQNDTISTQTVFNIPPDYYFVLGDNRTHSTDSRDQGFIQRSQIKARVFRCLLNCVDTAQLSTVSQ